jgi:hypothetical protein
MSKENKLTLKENLLIENIINKLQIYMTKNNQNLYSLATTIGFAYQPFYRLIKNRNLPTISSLAMIADHLHCSIEELINDKIFLDVNVIDNFNEIANLDNYQKSRIYIPYNNYLQHVHDKFFAIKLTEMRLDGVEYCKVYTIVDQISTDGEFMVNYQDNITQFNVISTSSKFIIIESNNEEQRIQQDQFQPIAKFFCNALLFEPSNTCIQGVKS